MAKLNHREVLVIGGGVIGLSIARELHRKGVTGVTLLEKGVCGEESSWAAGGMLGPQAEADDDGAFFDFCSASRDLYSEFAAGLFAETGIDVGLERSGTLYLAFSDEDIEVVHERFIWQQRAGLAVEHLSAKTVRDLEPSISADVRGALYFPSDWQVDNRKLLTALRRYSENAGMEIRENTRVERLILDEGRVTGVETNAGSIFADQTILATGAWTSLIKLGPAELPLPVEPVLGQMICFQTLPGLLRHVIYSRRGYIVPRADGRVLAGSTSEHVGFKKAVTDRATTSLHEIAAEIAPFLGELRVADSWCGLRPFAADGLPILGEMDGIDGLFLATAHYRNGILLAPLTVRLSAGRLIRGEHSEYFQLFGPGRFSAVKAGAPG